MEGSLEKSHVKVLIVGAGAAGLGAAMKLKQSGIEFHVLEAQDKPGGRIQTHRYDQGTLELGAQWVHGEEGNPLYDFCVNQELLTDPKEDYSIEGKGIFLLPDGTEVPENEIEEASMIFNRIKEELATFDLDECSKYKSVDDIYRTKFRNECRKGPEVDHIMEGLMDWFTKFEIVDNACADVGNMSLRGYGDYVECPGVYYINFKEGYDSFVKSAIKYIGEQNVSLNAPVERVIISSDKEVSVSFGQGRTISCDHLILTPSVKIIKQMKFDPPLPKYKIEALNCFGFDAIDKIFLYWEVPFWSEHDFGFQILWPEYDEEFFKLHGEFLKGIYGFEKVNHNPNVLIAWIGGDHALQMEKLTDTTVLEGCYHLLLRFACKVAKVSRPSRLIRSSWGSNPYIGGAYSHRLLEFDKVCDPVEKLQRPLLNEKKPLVLFAGEATDPEYFSTVHGALRSGHREAQRIIDF